MPTTTKWTLRYPATADPANVPLDMQELAEDVENLGLTLVGTFAAKPTAATAKSGRTYFCTDTGQYLLSDGTNWLEVIMVPAGITDLGDDIVNEEKLSDALASKLGISKGGIVKRGKSIVATEESRTNVAYGLLTTPDRVQSIVVPTDGLLAIGYFAQWKNSIASAGRAAIFIGANQLVTSGGGAGAGPVVSEATGNSTADTYSQLVSSQESGILSNSATVNLAAPATTGHLLSSSGSVSGGSGVAIVFVAAGTYDISIQFKATSGSVTVKERKLWVRAIEF